ncbi:hypothetical protein [Lentilactobacillus buchneri]|uniref:hypothetical protein n=1 Tax=Lentilactobacillus buchneri TaxID=1581 RepID=UPI0021A865BA|nr:hypothetical protein [Lentilactobacillus buchneri]MCT2882646.1 hypothetical protein [Lentilactobacillus buchneri]
MATPNVGILTNAGKNLIDQVNAGQTKITFSKIVFSSMNNNQLTDEQIKALTTVAPQEIVVNNPEVTLDNNTGETRIRATGNNEALTDGVYVKTYAVYAKDDSGNEILYGLTVSPNPNYLPEYDGVTPQAVTYSYKVNISNTSNITFTNSNDVYVSDTDLAEAIQPYAKTIDVNQQLDKKVNVADMRKPASDVAGIDETVIDNRDNTITANGASYDLSKSGLTSLQLASSGSFNDLPLGTVFVDASKTADGPDSVHAYTTTTFYSPRWYGGRKAQIAIADNANVMFLRTFAGDSNVWRSWTLLSDDSKVVHNSDMRKPASDVAGIEEVNAKQDKLTITPADDSKVAHLSGANNFDTTPTVNNNPLLLASSLPSDLARTGQAQTFTAAQTFSIAPVINDASQDKGDNQAATMADLKSVEKSAWHQLDRSHITIDSAADYYNTGCLYRIDPVNKKIYINWIMVFSYNRNSDTNGHLDFSSIVSKFTSQGTGGMMYESGYNAGSTSSVFNISGSKISFLFLSGPSVYASGPLEDCWFGYDTLLI